MSASLLCFRPVADSDQRFRQQSPRIKRPQLRIDRSTIGLPTNFVHTAHIGSRDFSTDHQRLMALQLQMQSKGGYQEDATRSTASAATPGAASVHTSGAPLSTS